MRKIKKLLCAALASTMVLAMAAPSFAADGQIVVTPSNTASTSGTHTYTAYQIFRLESYKGTGQDGNYAYIVNQNWASFIKDYAGSLTANDIQPYVESGAITEAEANAAVGKAFLLNSSGYMLKTSITSESEEASAFAKAALEEAKKNNSITGITGTSSDGKNATIDVDLGYYVVDSTVGSLLMLTTNAPTASITDKNEVPTITKTRNSDDAAIQLGKDIEYTITVDAKKGANNYVIHDIMSDALTLKKDGVTVVLKETGKLDTTLNADQFEVVEGACSKTDKVTGCKFEIRFTDKFDYTKIEDTTTIAVTYKATVNANALKDDVTITNKAKLTYGNGEETPETPEDPGKSDTYQFTLQKTNMTADGEPGDVELTGAQFKLFDAPTDGNEISLVAVKNAEGKVDYYRVAVPGETLGQNEESATVIVAGSAVIKGLDDTNYYLQEEKAPQGYNKLVGRVEIKPVKTVKDNAAAPSNAEAKIANSTGALLPSTGGIGTTIFYAVGIILMAGAVFFVVRRKRA